MEAEERNESAPRAADQTLDFHEVPLTVTKIEFDAEDTLTSQRPHTGVSFVKNPLVDMNLFVKEEYLEIPPTVIKIEYDAEDALKAQEPHRRVSYKKDVMVNIEDETKEVTIKQELDIGPTVLQPMTMFCPPLSPTWAGLNVRPGTSSAGGAPPVPLCTAVSRFNSHASDGDDLAVEKKQKIKDDHSTACSEISNTCAQSLSYETKSTESNQRANNRAAERSRLYRARHREKINARRRDIRQSQRKSLETHTASDTRHADEVTPATSNNKQNLNPHTQRQRQYYERHRAEINERKRDNRRKRNISRSSPATGAERNRAYRQRNKQKINERRRNSRRLQQNLQRIHTE